MLPQSFHSEGKDKSGFTRIEWAEEQEIYVPPHKSQHKPFSSALLI